MSNTSSTEDNIVLFGLEAIKSAIRAHPQRSWLLPCALTFAAHALMEEEVVLRSTVRQRTMGVAYRYVECEQHWLAGVGGHRCFTFTNQWGKRATQIISQGTGNVGGGRSLICKKEREKQTFRNLTHNQTAFAFILGHCESPHNPWANAQKQQDIDYLNMRRSLYLIY